MAAIAQLGERQTEDLKVPGSILGLGTCPQPQLWPPRKGQTGEGFVRFGQFYELALTCLLAGLPACLLACCEWLAEGWPAGFPDTL